MSSTAFEHSGLAVHIHIAHKTLKGRQNPAFSEEHSSKIENKECIINVSKLVQRGTGGRCPAPDTAVPSSSIVGELL